MRRDHDDRYPPPPRSLGRGRYQLQEPLGTGGMAVVYRVVDTWFRTDRALKLLLPQNARTEKTRERFLKEARTMSVLDHRNIVRIQDIGEEDGHFYFVMELCSGGSLAHYLRRNGARDPREALGFAFQVLQGLDYAHTAGVVHRDIKPHNVLLASAVDPDDDEAELPQAVVKLTDFGIARLLAMANGSRITGTGDTLGTLAYMSPEQRADPREAGPASDIYGVGATLYILVTGRRPFDLAMSNLEPQVLERLPPELRPIVRRATAFRPADRYQSAREMAVAVAEAWERISPDTVRAQEKMGLFPDIDDDTTLVAPGADGEATSSTWNSREGRRSIDEE